jgi:thiosulfate/3-mercaptopyruvate sulfurtransferase
LPSGKPEIVAGFQTIRVIPMGGGLSCLGTRQKYAGLILVLFLLMIFNLNFILSTALAGTETGEFCPTCPDWTDLDGWLAKKDAYEKTQQNGADQDGQAKNNMAAPNHKVDPIVKGYVKPELLTSADLIKGNQIILDVRTLEDYRSGHIPGARSLYWKDLQKDGSLDPDLAKDALCRAGVNDSDHLLVYGDSKEGAAYVFWALCYLGHEDLSLLDGGADAAWDAALQKDKSQPSVLPSNYTIRVVPWLLVTPANLDHFLSQADVQILDARDFSDYGRGRLTNASVSFTAEKLYSDSKIKDAATLEELLGRRNLDEMGTQIVYGTPQAYLLYYSLKLMGYNATLIEGDWWKETSWAVSNVK